MFFQRFTSVIIFGGWYRWKSVAKQNVGESSVTSTVLPKNGSVNWPWSGAMLDKARAREAKILRLNFRARMCG